jgi:hypothetical protein
MRLKLGWAQLAVKELEIDIQRLAARLRAPK